MYSGKVLKSPRNGPTVLSLLRQSISMVSGTKPLQGRARKQLGSANSWYIPRKFQERSVIHQREILSIVLLRPNNHLSSTVLPIYIYIYTYNVYSRRRKKKKFPKNYNKIPPPLFRIIYSKIELTLYQQKEGKNHGKRARTLESRALLYTTKASTKNTHEGYAIPVSVDERSDVRMRTPTLGGCAWAYVRAHTCARR